MLKSSKSVSANQWIILLTIGLLIILAGLFIYFTKFHGHLSEKSSEWNDFSSFINPFIASANLIIITWLSMQIYNYNQEKDSQTDIFQKTIEKPILIFRITKDIEQRDIWEVHNIGKGAAINLRIGESGFREVKWTQPILKCYSLGNNEGLKLYWLNSANIICVTYEDVFENKYVSIVADSETHLRSIDKNFKEIKIEDHIFSKKDFDDYLNLRTDRLSQAVQNDRTPTTTSQTTIPS